MIARPSRGDVRGRLAGRTAIVTGAAQGIGKGIARLFAAAGAHVVAADLDGPTLAATVEDIRAVGGAAVAVTADMTAPDSAKRLVGAARAAGRLDILVNNAATYAVKPLLETSDEEWRDTLDACLTQVFAMSRAAVAAMVADGQGGAIVNIASVNQILANPNLPAYTAAKGGVRALTMQIAMQYGPRGVRCNALSPGLVVTEKLAPAMTDYDVRMNVEAYPVGRLGAPLDVAYAALFLASDESCFVNGVDLPVDGGLSVVAASALVSPRVRRWYGRAPWPDPQEKL
ncbi:MAG: glucose 1-dehydrogenase [Alphaproteobacteria bacterium]|nr:glucose 1-dehydrogenase [Alphaproteobacteria bacterium]